MSEEQFKVLMIDDEPDIIQFFSDAFRNFSHIKFMTALRGQQGIEIARTEKPTLVMIDLRMPGINGEQALKELKSFLPHAKFIVMTGWEDGETRERILKQIGVDAYFAKPIDLEKVITKAMSLLMVKGGPS